MVYNIILLYLFVKFSIYPHETKTNEMKIGVNTFKPNLNVDLDHLNQFLALLKMYIFLESLK